MKATSKEIILSSSFHGVPSIVRTEHFISKVMWTFFTLISAAFCFYVNVRTVFDYLNYDVTTKIVIHHETPIDFPMITVCNVNPFVTPEASTFMNELIQARNFSFGDSSATPSSIEYENEMTRYLELSEIAMQEAWTNFSEKRKASMGYSFKEMTIDCMFAEKLKCSTFSDEIVRFYHFRYGNCFQFNSGRDVNGRKVAVRQIDRAGDYASFKMEIFVGVKDGDTQWNKAYKHSGARIFISNQAIVPLLSEGLELSTWSHTSIGVNRIFSKRLGAPYSDCVEDLASIKSPYYKYIVAQNRSYRQINCRELALQDSWAELANCYWGDYPNYKNLKTLCTNATEKNNAKFADSVNKLKEQKIKDFCPQECNSMVYSFNIYPSGYPAIHYMPQLKRHPMVLTKFSNASAITDELVSVSMVSFSVYYNAMKYTQITEAPSVTPVALISKIGGTLGLFLGISLLSFIEIVEIVIEMVFVY